VHLVPDGAAGEQRERAAALGGEGAAIARVAKALERGGARPRVGIGGGEAGDGLDGGGLLLGDQGAGHLDGGAVELGDGQHGPMFALIAIT
jgi:hypothetical protein